MMPNFARKELLSLLWIKRGIAPCTLTTGQSANTYDADPQPAAGIDSWDSGALRFRNLLLVIDVYSITTGTLDFDIMDSPVAITTANGSSVCHKVADIEAISAAGLYVVEIQMDQQIFPAGSARVTAHDEACEIMRHINIRATATGGTCVFSALCIFGRNLKDFPVQDATILDPTFYVS